MVSSTPARRRRRGRWIPWVVLLAGVLLLAYPQIAKVVRDHRDAAVVEGFQSETLDRAERRRLAADVARYNASLTDGRFNTADPFAGGAKQSASTFSAAGEVLGVLKLPTLGVELPIRYGTDAVTLAKGVGLLERTSFPGTKGGNSVLTGHRGMADAQLFRHLERLRPGDAFYVVDHLDVKKYVVAGHDIVLPNETGAITLDPKRDQVTLLTCDPYLVNSHRLLVFSDRAPISKAEIARFGPGGMPDTGGQTKPGAAALGLVESLTWMLGVVLVLGLVRVGWLNRRRRAKRSSAQLREGRDGGGLSGQRRNRHQRGGGKQGQGCDSATKS